MFKSALISKDDPRKLSVEGESLAKKYLKKNGYKILKRNYVSKCGEIDIIAYDRGTIAFIEVKTRLSESFGPPELAITDKKKYNIIRTAMNYLKINTIEDVDFRFDVVSVVFKNDSVYPDIQLLKDAFTADGVIRT